MKKTLAFLLCIFILMCLTACGSAAVEEDSSAPAELDLNAVGNTPGNIARGGIAVSTAEGGLAYLADASTVCYLPPDSKKAKTLAELENGEYYDLNAAGDYLYYISRQKGNGDGTFCIRRLNLLSGEEEVLNSFENSTLENMLVVNGVLYCFHGYDAVSFDAEGQNETVLNKDFLLDIDIMNSSFTETGLAYLRFADGEGTSLYTSNFDGSEEKALGGAMEYAFADQSLFVTDYVPGFMDIDLCQRGYGGGDAVRAGHFENPGSGPFTMVEAFDVFGDKAVCALSVSANANAYFEAETFDKCQLVLLDMKTGKTSVIDEAKNCKSAEYASFSIAGSTLCYYSAKGEFTRYELD